MGKSSWRSVLCCFLILLFAMAVFLYIRELKSGCTTKGATLVTGQWTEEDSV